MTPAYELQIMRDHKSKNSLLTVTNRKGQDVFWTWWKALIWILWPFSSRRIPAKEGANIKLLQSVTSAFEDKSHPPTEKDSFLYLQLKEGNYFIIGLLLGLKKSRKYFYSGSWFHTWAKPSGFVTWYSPQSQIFKNRVPVSQLRLRTHKLARPSAVLCKYYLLLGQNLFKSACNSMKPQQLHLQTIWPTIFSSLVMLMQREKNATSTVITLSTLFTCTNAQ